MYNPWGEACDLLKAAGVPEKHSADTVSRGLGLPKPSDVLPKTGPRKSEGAGDDATPPAGSARFIRGKSKGWSKKEFPTHLTPKEIWDSQQERRDRQKFEDFPLPGEKGIPRGKPPVGMRGLINEILKEAQRKKGEGYPVKVYEEEPGAVEWKYHRRPDVVDAQGRAIRSKAYSYRTDDAPASDKFYNRILRERGERRRKGGKGSTKQSLKEFIEGAGKKIGKLKAAMERAAAKGSHPSQLPGR